MKSSVWYNGLWQNKMLELPLEGDANIAWQKMQDLLNENMPVTTPDMPVKQGKSLLSKLISVVAIIVTIALLYYIGTLVFGNHAPKHNKIKNDHKLNNRPLNVKPKANGNNRPNTTPDKINVPGKNNTEYGSSLNKHNYKNQQKTNTSNTAAAHKKNAGISNKFLAADNYNRHSPQTSNYRHYNSRVAALGNNYLSVLNTGNRKNYRASYTPVSRVSYSNNFNINITFPAIDSINTNGPLIINNDAVFIKPANIINSKATGPLAKNQDKLAPTNHKAPGRNKSKPVKNTNNSKFGLGLGFGLNTNNNSSLTPFGSISGSYFIIPKLSLSTGAAISERMIRGTYSNSNYQYITLSDSGKRIINTADKLVINSSEKIFTLNIPIIISYKVTNNISFHAGTVIIFPLKAQRIKNTLNPIKNPSDTLSAYNSIDSTVNTTTITNKINFSITGGIRLNLNRFYIDADYLQGFKPYIISSSLGSTKTYYHTFQFGIGFLLLKPKTK